MFGLQNYYFLVPIIGMIPWTGMLITMLVCWGVQGHPIYSFMDEDEADMLPVYISDIGATNLQGLFIAGAAWQAVFYVMTILLEYWLRKKGKLQYWFKKSERNWMFAGVVLGSIGQLGIFLVSCFKISKWDKEHHIFLGVFIVGVFLSMIFIMIQYFMMGINYRKIHVSHKYWNKFTVSAWLKLAWTLGAAIFAILFVGVSSDSLSAVFEWTLAFWYTFLWFVFAWDLFPAAKTSHKNQPYIHDWSKHGFYLYDEHFGNSDTNEDKHTIASQGVADTLVGDQENAEVFQTNREFTDQELSQYPLTNDRETYPIPHGQQVPLYDRVN